MLAGSCVDRTAHDAGALAELAATHKTAKYAALESRYLFCHPSGSIATEGNNNNINNTCFYSALESNHMTQRDWTETSTPTWHVTPSVAMQLAALMRCMRCGLIKAKFHYTDPTRTRHGPDTDKVRARCRVRAKFHYTDPHGLCRRRATRTDPTEFRRKKSPCGSVRVRVGSV